MSARHFEGEEAAEFYAKFRPFAPQSVTDRILDFLKEKIKGELKSAVDVGCGSGQSTAVFGPHFASVNGVDISEAQISQATARNKFGNITYKVSPAETLPFEGESVQLVTAGTACHWFDVQKFYAEADRILVPNGVIAVFSVMGNPSFTFGDKSSQLTDLFHKFYYENIKPFSHPEVDLVHGEYTDPRFTMPYPEIIRENHHIHELTLPVSVFIGFMKSWSVFSTLKKLKGREEADQILSRFQDDIMELLDVTTKPEDTLFTVTDKYVLLMGRKPSKS